MVLLIKIQIQVMNKGKIVKTHEIESDAPYLGQNIKSFLNKEQNGNPDYLSNFYTLASMSAGDIAYDSIHPSYIQLKEMIESLSF